MCVAGAFAQTNDGPKILFLHVRMEKGKKAELVESKIRDGELKPALNVDQADGIHFELLTKDGKSLRHGTTPDPTRRVVEFEDPPQSGKLKRKQVELADAEFAIRVPLATNAQRVEFYTLAKSNTNGVAHTNRLGSVIVPTK